MPHLHWNSRFPTHYIIFRQFLPQPSSIKYTMYTDIHSTPSRYHLCHYQKKVEVFIIKYHIIDFCQIWQHHLCNKSWVNVVIKCDAPSKTLLFIWFIVTQRLQNVSFSSATNLRFFLLIERYFLVFHQIVNMSAILLLYNLLLLLHKWI